MFFVFMSKVLLSLLVVAVSVHGRLLQQEGPACNETVKWDFDVCQSRGGGSSPSSISASLPVNAALPMAQTALPAMETSVAAATAAPIALAAPRTGSGGSGAGPLGMSGASFAMSSKMAAPMPAAGGGMASVGGIGFRTGGAQDVEDFRQNIKEGYLPLPTDITFEGVTKDYFFDTSSGGPACTELFCPLYSAAISPDPLLGDDSNQSDIFLAVGLDSGLTAEQARRKRLNLVLLLDISGSMGSPFDEYYYDQFGSQKQLPPEERSKTKIDVAKEVLTGILDKLAPEDSVGIVLFSDDACTPLQFGPVKCLDMAAVKKGVEDDVHDTSSTNLQAGFDQATNLLKGCRTCMEASLTGVENRIILITDAEPNTGDFTTEGLNARMKANAADNIFMTLVGVGLDFNTDLVEQISKVKGANYFSMHSPGEFKKRLNDDFDFAVTPLVFDLSMRIDPSSLAGSDSWKILHVYGSPNPNDTALSSNGTIMKVNTLFPSPKTEEGVKGGVVLLRMKPPAAANTPLQLTVTYTDRAGKQASSRRTVGLPSTSSAADGGAGNSTGEYESTGVHKAVLLARYVDALKDWLLEEWEGIDSKKGRPRPIVIPRDVCDTFPQAYCPLPASTYGFKCVSSGGCELERWLVPDGCILPPPWIIFPPLLGRWERQSEKLTVNSEAKDSFRELLPYMESEVAALGDSSLNQEVDILKKLVQV